MNKNEISKNKKKLDEELATLEAELKKLGRKNPDHPGEWEAKPDDIDPLTADDSETADKLESYEENESLLTELEGRYKQVKKALDKIKSGSYGICKICGEPIEKERLSANPAAETCIKHKDK